jgi:transposase
MPRTSNWVGRSCWSFDNLNAHISAVMKRLVAARPWLRVLQLPAYAPELNPVEAVW